MSQSRSDLIKAVADEAELSHTDAGKAVDAVLDALRNLPAGEKLMLRGFGTFHMKTRPARTARNPQTGLPVEVPARTELSFKPARA